MSNAETNDKAAAVAEHGPTVAPEKAPLKKAASQKKGAPKARKSANAAPKKEAKIGNTATRAKEAGTPRAGAKILAMVVRAECTTLAEIMEGTEWQAHSVRGYSSTAGKKHSVKIESFKNKSGSTAARNRNRPPSSPKPPPG
jgi:hypothetical protein